MSSRPGRSRRRRIAGPLAVLALLIASGGCGVPGPDGSADSFGLDLSLPDGARVQGAVIFVVDGVHAGIFQEMLAAGDLPAIGEYFADRGLYVPAAVANTPSVTLANLPSIATGLMPGHHGIVGVNWFDRDRLIWRNYATIPQKNLLDSDYTATTIFQRFPNASTYSLFHQPHRGATKFFENALSAVGPFGLDAFEWVDRITLYRFGQVAQLARRRNAWPAVTVCYLIAPDFRAYRHGINSPRYREALRHTDRQIGRVLGDFRRAGLLDKIVIVLMSDHGMTDVQRHLNVSAYLRNELALDVARARLWEQTPFEQRQARYERHRAVLNTCGDRYAALSLRAPLAGPASDALAPWPARPTLAQLSSYPTADGPVDLPARLIAHEAIGAVAAAAGADRVRLWTDNGCVELHQPAGRGGTITYRVLQGVSPFEAPADGSADPAGWLAATHGGDYADAPAQLLAYFRSRLAGDLVLFAAPLWDFNNVNRAGHGGLVAEELHVPLLMAGPGVPHQTLETPVRTVDLTPTILALLGRPVPADLDGRPIVTPGPSDP